MAENDRLIKEENPQPGSRPGYVPQHMKEGTRQFEITTGFEGRLNTRLQGRVTRESWSYDDFPQAEYEREFPNVRHGVSVSNDHTADLQFEVGQHRITVKPGEVFDDVFEGFNSIKVFASGDYRILIKE